MNEPKAEISHSIKPSESKSASYIEELKQSLQDYQRVPKESREEFLTKQLKVERSNPIFYLISNLYPQIYVDQKSGEFYGYQDLSDALEDPRYDACEQKLGMPPLLFLIHALNSAMKRQNALSHDLPFKEESQREFHGHPFEITDQDNFSTDSQDLIKIGKKYLTRIVEALLQDDEIALRTTMTSIESQYFHERIHWLSEEDRLDNRTLEEMTLLGEFLYDPAHNLDRSPIFHRLSHSAFNEEEARTERKWQQPYCEAWQKVDLIILLQELIERNLIALPIPNNPKQLTQTLEMLYASIPEQERMAILKKWIMIKKDELYKKCDELRSQMGIDYNRQNATPEKDR